MMGVYEYDRRSECIQNEGLLKGLLWCKTDYKSREELGVGHAVLVTKAMGWPLYFFRSSENFNEEINEEINEELKKLKLQIMNPYLKNVALIQNL